MDISYAIENIILRKLPHILDMYNRDTLFICGSKDLNRITVAADFKDQYRSIWKSTIFVFEREGKIWKEIYLYDIQLCDDIKSLDMSDDGMSIAIGMDTHTPSGNKTETVLLIKQTTNGWTSKPINPPSDAFLDTGFGNTVILTSKNQLVISTPSKNIDDKENVGCLSIYDGNHTGIVIYPPTAIENDYFSSEIYLDEEYGGNMLTVIGNYTGAYLLDLSNIFANNLRLVKK